MQSCSPFACLHYDPLTHFTDYVLSIYTNGKFFANFTNALNNLGFRRRGPPFHSSLVGVKIECHQYNILLHDDTATVKKVLVNIV